MSTPEEPPPPKVKRRQHVACDACKLRRIKCDLFKLLPSREQDSEEELSFREQVRRHPEVQCSNCRRKELRCTTEAIRNPAAPRKSGKRIKEARRQSRGHLDEGYDSDESDEEEDLGHGSGTSVKLFSETRAGIDELAAYIQWQNLVENLPLVTANAPAMPGARPQFDPVSGLIHNGVAFPHATPDQAMDWRSQLQYFMPGGRPKMAPFERTGPVILPVFQENHAESSVSGPRKRRAIDDGVVQITDKISRWHLWSKDVETLVWGRKEIVQERLADRALGTELSRHLISMYFQVVHYAFPAVNPETFYIEWMRAGQRSDQMTPSQEALCAVLEAWGAMYSDNPIVLGILAKREQAPIVWKDDGTTIPDQENQVVWGERRQNVCRALYRRVTRLLDYNGLYRRPTTTAVQALLMFSLLAAVTVENLGNDDVVDSDLALSAAVSHMSHLNLMWDSPGELILDPAELPLTKVQLRNKQRQIFWSTMAADALQASVVGWAPKIPEADVQAAGRWINVVQASLPLSSFKLVAYFMQAYYRLCVVARRMSTELGGPNTRPGTVDVAEFCKSIREQWADITALQRDLSRQAAELMDKCSSTLGYGYPLSRMVTVRLACPRQMFLQDRCIKTQLDFRKQLLNNQNSHSWADTETRLEEVRMLEALHVQSIDLLLQTCRAHVEMIAVILPTGLLQTAALYVRVMVWIALYVAAAPTNEQGYPNNTLGGCGWTWEAKKRDVGVCILALNQLGWASAKMQDAINAVKSFMDLMTPSTETLATYQPTPVDPIILAQRVEEREDDRRAMESALLYWPPESVPRLIDSVMAGLDIHSASPSELVQRLTPENLHAKAVQRRADAENQRIANGGMLLAGQVLPVDDPPQAYTFSQYSGLVDGSEQTSTLGADSHSVAPIPLVPGAPPAAPTEFSTTIVASQNDSPGWGTCMYHMIKAQKREAEQSRFSQTVASVGESVGFSVASTSARASVAPFPSQLPVQVPPQPVSALSTDASWGINFAIESGLFPSSASSTSNDALNQSDAGTRSGNSGNNADGLFPAPFIPQGGTPGSAQFQGSEDGMDQQQLAALEEFLLELDKLTNVQEPEGTA